MSTEADKIAAFFATYPRRTYPKGQVIIFAEENPDYVYYIVDGCVRKYDISYRGDEVIVNIFRPNAYFPMSWAINRSPNRFFYKTETITTVHVAPADDVVQFLHDNQDVLYDLMSRVYHGMEGMLGRMVHLMSGSAKRRLLYELILECRRNGKQTADERCELIITETDLAARSGLSRETVNRELRKLKTAGWVRVGSGRMTILRMSELEKTLGREI